MQLEKFYTISGILYWSGGRIGGSKETVEIAAVTDNPIIRHPITGFPYIPGSSLKGKIRSLLELTTEKSRVEEIDKEIKKVSDKDDINEAIKWANNEIDKAKRNKQRPNPKAEKVISLTRYKGAIQDGEPCGCGLESCQICRAFGPHKNTEHSLGPTRLIFRDAKMATKNDIKDTKGLPEEKYTIEDIRSYSIEKGLHYAEIKSENIINRHSGRASDPRQMERVIDGSLFKIEVVVRVFEGDEEQNKEPEDNPFINLLKKGMLLLEKDYLGGSGSRGYGKVKFYDMKIGDKEWSNFND